MRAERTAAFVATGPGISGCRLRLFSRFGKLLALALCCALFLFLSVEAAHAHPLGAPDPAHCSLCLLAHVAPYTTAAPPAHVVFVAFGAVAGRPVSSGHTAIRTVLRIRPPPGAMSDSQPA